MYNQHYRSNRPQNGRSFRNNKRSHHGAFIHPDRFVNKASAVENEPIFQPVHKFSDFNISQALKNNILEHGYTDPTPIQDGSIPTILEGKDLIGLANTGTGKTAAFIIPIINYFQTHNQNGTALIIAPTRELAEQIDKEFRVFARNLHLSSVLCVGGTSLHNQIRALYNRPNVVVGTPGRLKDLVNRKRLRLDTTQIFVLDEVDRMLDMGFINDIRFLVAQLPRVRQSLCFSATLTPVIEQLVRSILKDPITVSVKTRETSNTIDQDVIKVGSKEHKFQTLNDLLRNPEFEKVLIFGQTKFGVQHLSENLNKHGHKTDAIHGNKSQPQRQRALQSFKDNRTQVLVATDVAARGLDIPNVSHVINFDQPNTYDDYIHRIGRTGRAGKMGKALTFIQSN